VGDAANYTPVDVDMTAEEALDVTGRTDTPDNPNTGSSQINPAKTANRYWTLTPVGSPVVSYDATFHFVAADVDGSADPSMFIVERYDAGTWNTVRNGAKTATSTQGTVITGFGQFEAGEPLVAGVTPPPAEVITEFALARVSPNPTSGAARIEYTVPRAAKIRVTIVDLQGRTVAKVVDGIQNPGRYQAVWTGDGGRGRVSAGMYFVRYEGGGKVAVKRVALTR
jgi:hypothetical protein